MHEGKDEKHLPIYDSQPPKWLPKSHATADLGTELPFWLNFRLLRISTGYSGFFPPKPGQDEDVLSPERVKKGFLLSAEVSVRS